ncbi:MAG TPA: methyl-accepting chemotaxis protein [bacterium (Candidatus Stahlbacteria)]|nr:methyl-accepting chemotaxis protein [Candidatus Stahlbacteria bacterium]
MFETVDLEVEKVDKNQKITAQSLNQYDAIAKTIRLTSDQIKQVVDSTGHQSEETKQIAQQVDIITKVAEDTASSTEEVAAAVEQLTASLEELSSRASELAAIAKDLESLDRSIS